MSLDGGTSFTESSNVTHNSCDHHTPHLEYPRNFFHPSTGNGPANQQDAELFWQYRKSRPSTSSIETQVADGKQMLREIVVIRRSLKTAVVTSFMEEARIAACSNNLFLPGTNINPVTNRDFMTTLCSLEMTEENAQLVYLMCHKFHRDRQWIALAIDKWMEEENMSLVAPVIQYGPGTGKVKRQHSNDSGGFSVVGRGAKTQIVDKWMSAMLNKAKWHIVVANKGCIKKEYTRHETGVKGVFFYVATRRTDTDKEDEVHILLCCTPRLFM
jgi:hypothetical protein